MQSFTTSLLLLSIASVLMMRAMGNDSRTEEARERLKELREELAEQEKLVQALRDQVPQCHTDDRECKIEARRQAKKFKGHMGEFADDPLEDGLKLSLQTQLKLKGKPVMLRWLPFSTMSAHGDVKRMFAAVDSKGFLHVLDTSGRVLSSWPCGHAASVTSMAVSSAAGNVCYIATGSKNGEVRIHSMPAPPKFEISPSSSMMALKKARKIGRDGWKPALSHVHNFFPARASRLEKISNRSFEVSESSPAAEITTMQLLHKGKSLNVVVGDAGGKMFWTLLNGSLVSSRHVSQSQQTAMDVKIEDLAALPDSHWVLAGWSGGLSAMDIRQPSVQQVQCFKYIMERHAKSKGDRKAEPRLVDFEVSGSWGL
eukprot:768743-Hanusia_phi.AAC.6